METIEQLLMDKRQGKAYSLKGSIIEAIKIEAKEKELSDSRLVEKILENHFKLKISNNGSNKKTKK